MLRGFLRPLSWAAQRLRKLSTTRTRLGEELRHDPSLLIPKIEGYNNVNVAYRCLPKGDPIVEAAHDILATVAWAWIFYNLYHNHAMIHEFHEPPDPSKWTDEELGIPPE